MANSPRKPKWICFLALTFGLLLLGLGTPVRTAAQVAGGTILGTINDQSGAVIPNAKVTIKNIATGALREVTSNKEGFYTAPNLLPGKYEITASATGFRTEVASDIILTVGAQHGVNLSMRVGTASEKVEVTAAPNAVELTTSSLGDVVNSTTTRELPLNGRDWTQLATLQPGITTIASQPTITTGRTQRGLGTQLTISGGRPQQNNYRLDGVNINDYGNGAPGSVLGQNLGVDAIEEFSVLTSNYSAEYGRTSGGVVNAVTRSGSNAFHGDVYEFLRNSALDARNFFDATPQPPPFKRNQFGASAGGPIRKDRTFIFGDYEGIRQNLGLTFRSTVPSLAARNGQLSTGPVNVDLALKPYLAFYPPPNGLVTGDTGQFNFSGPQTTREDFFTIKTDHRFSGRDNFSSTYLFDDSKITQPDELDQKLVGSSSRRQVVALEETHIFSSGLANSARFGFSRAATVGNSTVAAINKLAADATLSFVPGQPASGEIDVPGVLTPFTGGLDGLTTYTFHWNSFQGYDDAFLTKGIHSLKFGFAVERMQDNLLANNSPDGVYTFNTLGDFLTNNPFVFTAAVPGTLTPRGIRQTLFGGYAQDDIRLHSNLTVNLGVRYEMTTVPTEVQGKLSNVRNLSDAQPHLGSPFFSNPTYRNFEPRVGIAWDPFQNGKTAVRGGFGMFDVLPLPYEFGLALAFATPFFLQGVVVGPPFGPAIPLPKAGFAAIVSNPNPFFIAASVQPNPRRDYVMQWNLNIQREIVNNLTVMVAYVGNRGVHQPFRSDEVDLALPAAKTPEGFLWPFPVGSGKRINQNFGDIQGLLWGADSYYHSLQAQVNKRLSRGFQVQGSYTWAKGIDTGSATLVGDPYANSLNGLFFFDPRLRRGLSDFDIRQNGVISFVWNMPKPQSLSGAAGWALGGWELGGIFQARAGLPFSVVIGGDPLGTQAAVPLDFPDRVRGCKAINGGVNYLNASCFALPAATPDIAAQCQSFGFRPPNPSANPPDPGSAGIAGTCANLLGNSGRNTFIGPGLVNFDMSLAKNSPVKRISENFKVQFRAEFFNIFNHPYFLPPTANNAAFDGNGNAIGNFGVINATATPSRQIQFGLKFIW